MPGIYRLQGTVKHYDWGGTHYIPVLLKIPNTENRPFAEYWMGIHPLGISQVEMDGGAVRPLTDFTHDLPYLLKVLDVKDMLSIQVHPSKYDAGIEFERENSAGIPLDSPVRNYKDRNHKPEMLVALSDFYLLHGFKPVVQLRSTLESLPELGNLLAVFESSGYQGLYREVMTMPQDRVDKMLQPLLNRITPLYLDNRLNKEQEDFWAARAAITFARKDHSIDRGIFSIYLFNIVHLKAGESLFQGAGLPHAYLEGQNVELMSNSDNVLRGGLTTKHIDVGELLKHVKCESTQPALLKGKAISDHEWLYTVPVDDFELSVIRLNPGQVKTGVAASFEIFLVAGGAVQIGNEKRQLEAGHPAAVVLPGTHYELTGIANQSLIFRAGPAVHTR